MSAETSREFAMLKAPKGGRHVGTRTPDLYRVALTPGGATRPEPGQEALDLAGGDALAAAGHEQTIPDFIEPDQGNQRSPIRQSGQNVQAVLPLRFVF